MSIAEQWGAIAGGRGRFLQRLAKGGGTSLDPIRTEKEKPLRRTNETGKPPFSTTVARPAAVRK